MCKVYLSSLVVHHICVSYIGSVYLLTSTVFLPVFASLADIFGRHWALQIGFVFFLVGSALSTGAQNMDMMLAGRGIAGVGAAGLITVSHFVTYSERYADLTAFRLCVLSWPMPGLSTITIGKLPSCGFFTESDLVLDLR